MKTFRKYIKPIALILSMLIISQSCTVYKPVPISIDQAVQAKSKVKVVTKDNQKIKLTKIDFENGTYYGVKRIRGNNVKVPLNENTISYIKEKDKVLSTFITIGISTVVVAGILGIMSLKPQKSQGPKRLPPIIF